MRTVLIGASTGGTEALYEVLSHYPTDGPPTLIVQHIRPQFLDGLAERLDRVCSSEVMPASHNAPIKPGAIYVAPGDDRHMVVGAGGQKVQLVEGPHVAGHRPSVDQLFMSASRLGSNAVAVLLTGMGQDGAAGLLKVRAAGGRTIAQDKESSAVFGMPRAAIAQGAAQKVLPITEIGREILIAASYDRERSDHV